MAQYEYTILLNFNVKKISVGYFFDKGSIKIHLIKIEIKRIFPVQKRCEKINKKN